MVRLVLEGTLEADVRSLQERLGSGRGAGASEEFVTGEVRRAARVRAARLHACMPLGGVCAAHMRAAHMCAIPCRLLVRWARAHALLHYCPILPRRIIELRLR